MRTKRKYTTTKWSEPAVENNLFEIEEGHVYHGNRANNPYVDLLIKQMIKLPVDKTKSIFIPISVAPSKNSAQNLLLNAKRRIKVANRSAYYTLKTISSVDKKSYLGSRIWRLA